jgi:cytochrome c5
MRWRWLVGSALVALAAGCTRLPEPDSTGAKLYAVRCNTCHRLYAPTSLKYAMWKYQVARMQGEMQRRGIPPLTDAELSTILEYLKRHSG